MTEHDATLERRIYARIDEVLGPINGELDAVNTRLDALAGQYEALSARVARHTEINEQEGGILDQCRSNRTSYEALSANFHSFKETVDRVLDSYEGRFEQWARRDKQVEPALEGLARDVVGLYEARDALSDRISTLENGLGHPHAVGALRDEVQQLREAVKTARAVNVEQTARIGCYGQKIEELTHALEDHVHTRDGTAAPPTFVIRNATDKSITVEPPARSTVEYSTVPQGYDGYEVDGRAATRAEYEAAENDPQAPHTTRHVHRPFSSPPPYDSPEGAAYVADAHCSAHAEPTEPVHDIGWAMKQLAAGKKVRRKTWRVGVHWYRPTHTVRKILQSDNRNVDAVLDGYVLNATDWEIA